MFGFQNKKSWRRIKEISKNRLEFVIFRRQVSETSEKMASSADVRDIMGLPSAGPTEITKEMILGTDKPKKIYPKKSDTNMKRPEGMARELYNLLYNDSKDAPPLIPTGKDIFDEIFIIVH